MLGALHVLAEELGNSALLRRAEDLVTSRYHCYGALEFPPSCTREIAWQVLKGALLSSNYWLSVAELQCFLAMCGVRVRVFLYYVHTLNRPKSRERRP